MKCQSIEHWVMFEDGEKSVNESRQLREHLAGCPRCAELYQKALDWVAVLSGPVGELSAEAAATRVLARLDERVEQFHPARALRGAKGVVPIGVWVGLVSSAAALALVVGKGVFSPPSAGAPVAARSTGQAELAARGPAGAAAPSLSRQVGVSFHVVGDMRKLYPGDTLHVGDAIVGAYVNLGAVDTVYALSFAVDRLGDVHWLYPAYLHASDDPAAVVLGETGGSVRLMPEAVVVDGPAGPSTILTLSSQQALSVRQIEAMPASSLTVERLIEAFPGVEVSELKLELVD